LIAFVVPGPDSYSIAQGVSTSALGGIDTGIIDPLDKECRRLHARRQWETERTDRE
jgi:hypothetical protein